MDTGQFDELTRTVFAGTGGRRALARFLTGTALGGVAARFGLDEDAVAKAKRHGKRHQDHQPAGQVRAAGKKHKGNGKHKNKDKRKDKDKPRQCPAGFRLCSNDSCVGDKPGICCLDEEFCPGGGCRAQNECCPGQKSCGKNECIDQNECCEMTAPLCTGCDEAICENGAWTCRSGCAPNETCCMGVCVPPCANGCGMDDGCGHCTQPPEGTVYCAAQDACVSTVCPPGERFDSDTCQCKQANVCLAGPESCTDYTPYRCGTNPNCHCLIGINGNLGCSDNVAYPMQVTCTKDADCDWIWGATKGICGKCKQYCYHKCPE